MFFLLNISDKILLDPGEFNPVKQQENDNKQNILSLQTPEQVIEKKTETAQDKYIDYSDLVYKKLRNKYISKILMGQGLVLSIHKFNIKSNLIIEIEGLLNVDVSYTILKYN